MNNLVTNSDGSGGLLQVDLSYMISYVASSMSSFTPGSHMPDASVSVIAILVNYSGKEASQNPSYVPTSSEKFPEDKTISTWLVVSRTWPTHLFHRLKIFKFPYNMGMKLLDMVPLEAVNKSLVFLQCV